MADWVSPPLVWFIAGFIMLLMELAAPGLVIFFFGVGAWVVCLVCLAFNISVNIQLFLFIVVSLALLFMLRSYLTRVFHGMRKGGEKDWTEDDEFVGRLVTVTQAIGSNTPGRVEFRGSQWDAESDVEIPEGAKARITGKRNITLLVSPL